MKSFMQISLKAFNKRCFVLLEVLIAMGLTIIILSALMGFYFEVSRINIALEKEQQVSFHKLYLTTRLSAILPKTVSPAEVEKDFFFYSSLSSDPFSLAGSQSLTFVYDNGVKLDPAFSNNVLARLYVNSDGELCLATWPSPRRWNEFNFPPVKHEVLFTGVENLAFEFYVPPYKDRKTILANTKGRGTYKQSDLLKLNPEGEWKQEWQQDYEELPALVRIVLRLKSDAKSSPDRKMQEEQLTFLFPLPNSRLIIVYGE